MGRGDLFDGDYDDDVIGASWNIFFLHSGIGVLGLKAWPLG